MCRFLSACEGRRDGAYVTNHCHSSSTSHQEAKHGGREIQEDSAMIEVRLNNILLSSTYFSYLSVQI